jgi:hypothetical protein
LDDEFWGPLTVVIIFVIDSADERQPPGFPKFSTGNSWWKRGVSHLGVDGGISPLTARAKPLRRATINETGFRVVIPYSVRSCEFVAVLPKFGVAIAGSAFSAGGLVASLPAAIPVRHDYEPESSQVSRFQDQKQSLRICD